MSHGHGNTPLVRLRRCAPANGAELWLKLEYRNPTGSMKDRLALAMIEGAERDGLITDGDTVVEYTGGSTGPALALVCRAKGYQALSGSSRGSPPARTSSVRTGWQSGSAPMPRSSPSRSTRASST
jgi:threonine synthase